MVGVFVGAPQPIGYAQINQHPSLSEIIVQSFCKRAKTRKKWLQEKIFFATCTLAKPTLSSRAKQHASLRPQTLRPMHSPFSMRSCDVEENATCCSTSWTRAKNQLQLKSLLLGLSNNGAFRGALAGIQTPHKNTTAYLVQFYYVGHDVQEAWTNRVVK